MTDKDFTKELDLLVKFQRLLKEGIDYDTSYYLTYNRWHEDYLREKQKEIESKMVMPTLGDIMDTLKVITDDFLAYHPEKKKKIVGKIENDDRVGMVDDGFIPEQSQNF